MDHLNYNYSSRHDEEGVDSDSESTIKMRKLRHKVQASQAGDDVSFSGNKPTLFIGFASISVFGVWMP